MKKIIFMSFLIVGTLISFSPNTFSKEKLKHHHLFRQTGTYVGSFFSGGKDFDVYANSSDNITSVYDEYTNTSYSGSNVSGTVYFYSAGGYYEARDCEVIPLALSYSGKLTIAE